MVLMTLTILILKICFLFNFNIRTSQPLNILALGSQVLGLIISLSILQHLSISKLKTACRKMRRQLALFSFTIILCFVLFLNHDGKSKPVVDSCLKEKACLGQNCTDSSSFFMWVSCLSNDMENKFLFHAI